jgi:hypothetical protein
MHTYVRNKSSESLTLDALPFRCAEDVVRYAASNRAIGSHPFLEVWHLDEFGMVRCTFTPTWPCSLVGWACDPWELRRSWEEGLRRGDCAHDWVIVESRPCGSENAPGEVSAVDLVRAGSEAVGGKGGGGRPDMAQAGGPDGSRADAALQAIEARLNAA